MAGRNRHFVVGYLEARIRDVMIRKHHDAAPRRLRVTLRNRMLAHGNGRFNRRADRAARSRRIGEMKYLRFNETISARSSLSRQSFPATTHRGKEASRVKRRDRAL
jgi:hypothetical protein